MSIKICLDAGHYGKYNRSPVVKEYYESDMNWALHLKLKAELEKYNISVVTTRSNKDKDLENTKRGKLSKGCNFFISLHSNAAKREDADHIVIFVPVDDNTTDIDEKSRGLAKVLAPAITKLMGVKETNYRIAGVKSANDRNQDGVLNDNYYGVLHGARTVETPALIIEHSFHTNTRATKWLMDDSNLEKLAKEEAKIIAEYLGAQIIKKLYRVQVGSFFFYSNASKRMKELKGKGFSAFIVKSGLMYRVQVGAYTVKKNAQAMKNKIVKAGYSAIIVES